MTNIRHEEGEPAAVDASIPGTSAGPTGAGWAGPGPDDVRADSVPPDAGIGTRGKGRDDDEGERDLEEEEAVRQGRINAEPSSRHADR